MNRQRSFILILILFCSAAAASGQKLPERIRGYKVHQVNKQATNSTQPNSISVDIGEPQLVDIGLTGMTAESAISISGLDQNGDVDFLLFKDLTANGIALDVEEYRHPFSIKKGEVVKLPLPVRGSVSTLNMAKAAYSEATDAREQWQIKGTVFVFGRFKKFGMSFKRVIPVAIDLTIPNPLGKTAAARR